jgi:hypothetical protein
MQVFIASGELPAESRQQLAKASRRLGRYLQATDESQLLTTYFATAPWVPTKDHSAVHHNLGARVQLGDYV